MIQKAVTSVQQNKFVLIIQKVVTSVQQNKFVLIIQKVVTLVQQNKFVSMNQNVVTSVQNNQLKTFIKFRVSDHKLFIEEGRRKRPIIPRNERICKTCNKIEDESHFLIDCDN